MSTEIKNVNNSETTIEKENAMEIIKAEKVNDFELKSDYDFTAVVTVKVKNKIFEMNLTRNKPFRAEEYLTETRVAEEHRLTFEELEIEVDYSDVIAEYENKLKEWEAEKEKARVAKAKENYRTHWAHDFKKAVDALGDSDVVIKFMSEKDYVDNCARGNIGRPHIVYKGYDEDISFTDNSRWRSETDMRYVLRSSLTDYRSRKYKKVKSLVKKFKGLVDDAIESKVEREKANKERLAKNEARELLVKRLEEEMTVDGVEVEVEVNFSRSSYNSYHTYANGVRLSFKWDGGSASSSTHDGKEFTCPLLKEDVDAETLKRFVTHVKNFNA